MRIELAMAPGFTVRTFIRLSLVIPLLLCLGCQAQPTCPAGPDALDALSMQASSYLWSLDPRHVSSARQTVLQEVYAPCGFRLLWSNNGVVSPEARSVMFEMGRADQKGLIPADYGLAWWGCRANATEIHCADRYSELAQFDVDLTVAVRRFVSDLRYGRARPGDRDAGYQEGIDRSFLADSVRRLATQTDASSVIVTLEPSYPGYRRAENALKRLLAERPDKETVLPRTLEGTTVHASGPAIRLLIQRLGELSYLPSSLVAPLRDRFDDLTSAALAAFQRDHGLRVSATVDAETLRALNVPLARRAQQLALTLERWRWVPQQFARGPIVVNIPEFRLRAYDAGGTVQLSMAVIVGKAGSRKSPVLQAQLERVVFHPYWSVPANIARHEIAPLARRDSTYLARHDFEVVGRDGRVLSTSGSAAAALLVSGGARVRQRPGALNALGNLKFDFPNAFDVYMHGTPQTSLFQDARRDFSHGCIRVEDPKTLAVWVLQQQRDVWTSARVEEELGRPGTRVVSLDRSLPVFIVYGTGIVTEDGTLRFFNDIYGYDARLEADIERISTTRQHEDHIAWSPILGPPH